MLSSRSDIRGKSSCKKSLILFVTHIFILLILVSGVQGDGWLLQIGAEIQTAGQGIFFSLSLYVI
jgi:hypothetical protein